MVSYLETLNNLDCIDGAATQLHLDAHRLFAAVNNLEQSDRRIWLALYGSADIENIREPVRVQSCRPRSGPDMRPVVVGHRSLRPLPMRRSRRRHQSS